MKRYSSSLLTCLVCYLIRMFSCVMSMYVHISLENFFQKPQNPRNSVVYTKPSFLLSPDIRQGVPVFPISRTSVLLFVNVWRSGPRLFAAFAEFGETTPPNSKHKLHRLHFICRYHRSHGLQNSGGISQLITGVLQPIRKRWIEHWFHEQNGCYKVELEYPHFANQ